MNASPLSQRSSGLAALIARHEQEIYTEWMQEMRGSLKRTDLKARSF